MPAADRRKSSGSEEICCYVTSTVKSVKCEEWLAGITNINHSSPNTLYFFFTLLRDQII